MLLLVTSRPRTMSARRWRTHLEGGPPSKGPCGYAFLKLFRRTGEQHWLDRARRFAVHAMEQHRRDAMEYGQRRYPLWTGDPGLAVYLSNCIARTDFFPTMDNFFGSKGVLATQRIDKSRLVFASIENFEHDRCVDFFSRPDGSFGCEEVRRDPEDRGAWTPVQYYSGATYSSKEAALTAARQSVAWLPEAIQLSPSAQRLLL